MPLKQRKKGYSKVTVTEDVYAQIKHLQSINLSTQQINAVVGASPQTINRIAKSDNYEVYKEQRRAAMAKYNAARVEPITNDSEVPTPTDEPTIDELIEQDSPNVVAFERIAVALERVATAQERLAAAWENAPTKKGLFK